MYVEEFFALLQEIYVRLGGNRADSYNPCIANMVINNHQMTVIWHIDDLKLLPMCTHQITKFALYLSNNYEKVTVRQGNIHNSLGMMMDHSKHGKLNVSMT